MSKKSKTKNGAAGKEPVAPSVKKDKIAIFMMNWKLVKQYQPNSPNTHVTSFRAGQIVFRDDEIESLLEQGAPIRIYVHDVEPTACGTD